MVPDYLVLGCCSLASAKQTMAYVCNLGVRVPMELRNGCACDPPPRLAVMPAPYGTPLSDFEACLSEAICPWWVDLNAPESFDFAGIVPVRIEGWESTESRDSQQGLLGGRAFGMRRQQGRCLTVTAYLVGKNCTAVQYGFSALTERLLDEDASPTSSDLWMLQTCIPAAEPNPDRFVVQIPGVHLTAPPKIIATYGKGRCTQTVTPDPPIEVLSVHKTIDTPGGVTTDSVFNGSYTAPTGTRRRLMVFVAIEADAVNVWPTTVTLDGVALTEIAHESIQDQTWDSVAAWYLDEDDLPVGAVNLQVTTSNPGTDILGLVAHCVMLENVSTADPPTGLGQSSSTVNNVVFEQAVEVATTTVGWVIGTIIGNRYAAADAFKFVGTAPTVDDVSGAFGAFGVAFNTAISHIEAPTLGVNKLRWTTQPATGGHDQWSALGVFVQQYQTPAAACVGCRGTLAKVQWTWCAPRDEIWSALELVCADETQLNTGNWSLCRLNEWLAALMPAGTCVVCEPDELPNLTCYPIPPLIPFAGPGGDILVTSIAALPTLADELTEFVDTAKVPVDAKAARLAFSTAGTAITADLNDENGSNHQFTLAVQTAVVSEVLLAIDMASTEIQTTLSILAGTSLYSTLLTELRDYVVFGGVAGATFDAFIAEIHATLTEINAAMVAAIDPAALATPTPPTTQTVTIPRVKSCYCPPLCATFAACKFVNSYKWSHSSVYVELFSGSAPLKNVRIRGYTPLTPGADCPADFVEFDASYACETPVFDLRFGEPGLPAGAWFTLDPVSRESSVIFADGRCTTAAAMIEGPGGAPILGSLEMSGCDELCVVVTAPCGTATDATFSLKARSKVRATMGF